MLFKEIQEPRSILFGMKMTRSEAEWLKARAIKAGVSILVAKSFFFSPLTLALSPRWGERG